MRPALFDEIKLERYAQLTAHMLPGCRLLMMAFDVNGDSFWCNVEDGSKIIDHVRNHPFDPGTAGNSPCCIVNVGDAGVLVYCPIRNFIEQDIANIVFLVQSDTAPGLPDLERLQTTFTNISMVMQGELGYIDEVNHLAMELGKRYDELSMLRASDNDSGDQAGGHHLIDSYMQHMKRHLGVDSAGIWIPDRMALFTAGEDVLETLCGHEYDLQSLARALHRYCEDGHDAVSIRELDSELRNRFHLPHAFELLAVPVTVDDAAIRGVIVCINRREAREFTFSDRKTMEAVSRKVGKYLGDTEDSLTGLYNRAGFEEMVNRVKQDNARMTYLALINVRQLSVINAAYGVATGDQVLRQLGRYLHAAASDTGFAGRLEGDHFALCITGQDRFAASELMSHIRDAARQLVFTSGSQQFSIDISLSLVKLEEQDISLSDYLYLAQLALESTCDDDTDEVLVFDASDSLLEMRRQELSMVERIKHAIDEDRFVLYAQRIMSIHEGDDHYEILVRMLDENGEIIPPNEFIPTAERYNVMAQIDRWVFDRTLRSLSDLEDGRLSCGIKWGINLSGGSMSDSDFIDHVSSKLQRKPQCASRLYFEITETAAIENYKNCASFMDHIHTLGIRFALDDFGSGLSSFSYLKKLSLDYLKIDGSLVKDVVESRLDRTMITAIASIAEVLGVKTIAEYVENEDILGVLDDTGIDYAQGFGIARPVPLEQVLAELGGDPPMLHRQAV